MDTAWGREFAGFFWGEGNFMIDIWQKQVKSKRVLANGVKKDYGFRNQIMIRIRVRISQREDSRAVLEHLVENLGGHIYNHKSRRMVSGGNGQFYTNQAQLVWQVQDREQISKILDILDQSTFPTLKRREISIIRQVIEILRTHKRGWTTEELDKLKALKSELSNLRIYTTC
jgi:RNA binding exosome subunit